MLLWPQGTEATEGYQRNGELLIDFHGCLDWSWISFAVRRHHTHVKTTSLKHWTVLVWAALCLTVSGCSREARTQGHLDRADAYFKGKEYEKARIEYLNVLRLNRTNDLAIVRLGEIFYRHRSYSRAVPFLARTIEIEPDNVEARERLAQIYLTARMPDRARQEARAILERHPSHETAMLIYSGTALTPEESAETEQRLEELRQKAGDSVGFRLAQSNLQVQRKDLEGAEASIRQALALNPQSERAHLTLANLFWIQEKLDEANIEFEKAVQSAPPESPTWMRLAMFKARTGRIDEAKKVLEQITKDTPEEVAAWNLRAEIALGEKRYDECAELIAKALRQDTGNYEALSLRARMKLAQGQFSEAGADLENLTTLFPRSAEAHYNLGLAYLLDKKLDPAVASLDKAIRLDPNHVNAVQLLAELQLARKNPSTTIELLTDFTRKFPRAMQARFLLARAYRVANRPGDALDTYHAMLKESPDNARAAYELGQTLQQQRQFVDARKAYELVIKLQTNSPAAEFCLVELDLIERNFPAATKRIEAQVARLTNSAPALLLQARVYGAQGMNDQVEASLRKAITVDPDLDQPYMLLARMYLASGRQSEALDQLNATLKENSNNVAALTLLGIIHDRAEAYDQSRAAYEKALQINTNALIALNNLAYLLSEKLKDPEMAYTYALRARKLRPDDPAITDTLGWIQYLRGQYGEAYALLTESSPQLENIGEAQYHFGVAAYTMGKEAEARRALAFAQDSTNDFSGKATITTYLAALGDDTAQPDDRLIAALEERCRSSRNDLLAWTRLAGLYETQGAYDKARTAYETALGINPAATTVSARLALLYAQRLNDPAKALKLAQEARKLAPNDPDVVLALGRVGFQSGDHAWAYGLLQEATRLRPDRPEVRYDLAWAAFSLGKVTEAEQIMQTVANATNAPPNVSQAATWFVAMTALLRQPDKIPGAEPQIQSLLQSVPDHAPALMAQAMLREQQGKGADASTIYEGLLTRYPGFSPATRQLAILLTDQGTDDAKAYDLATKARTALPSDELIAKALGKLAYRKGDYRYAAQLLRECAPKLPQDAEAYFLLGMACHQLKQTQEARTALETALRLKPDAPNATEARRILEQIKQG